MTWTIGEGLHQNKPLNFFLAGFPFSWCVAGWKWMPEWKCAMNVDISRCKKNHITFSMDFLSFKSFEIDDGDISKNKEQN